MLLCVCVCPIQKQGYEATPEECVLLSGSDHARSCCWSSRLLPPTTAGSVCMSCHTLYVVCTVCIVMSIQCRVVCVIGDSVGVWSIHDFSS